MSKGRVEAFSDGVFAVAATLLIFNIQLDKTAPGGLLAALLAAWPKYAAYVASFLTIGVMWINHHSLFERITRINRALMFLNLLLLMAIVFLPFPTAVLGSNILLARRQYGCQPVWAQRGRDRGLFQRCLDIRADAPRSVGPERRPPGGDA